MLPLFIFSYTVGSLQRPEPWPDLFEIFQKLLFVFGEAVDVAGLMKGLTNIF